MEGPEPGEWSRARLAAAWALLALVVLAVFGNGLSGAFVLDDGHVITRNPALRGGPLAAVAFTPRRAVGMLTFWANVRLAGTPAEPLADGSWGPTTSYHLVNVALHVLAAGLLFSLVAALLDARAHGDPWLAARRRWLALAAAILWVAHPAHVFAVTYITQREAQLAAVGVLGALLAYARLRLRIEAGRAFGPGERRGTHALLAACVGSCALAFGSKENAAATPLLLLVLEAAFFDGRGLEDAAGLPRWLGAVGAGKRRWLLASAPLPLLVAGALQRLHQVPLAEFFPPSALPTFPDRASYFHTEWVVVLAYLRLFFLPHDVAIDEGFPRLDWATHGRELALALAAHALLATLAVLWWRRGARLLAFAVLGFYLSQLVESALIPILDPMADQRLYLPGAFLAAGTAVALALVGRELAARPEAPPELRRRIPAAIGLVAALACLEGAAAAIEANASFASPLALWTRTSEARPASPRSLTALGEERLRAARRPEDLVRAIEPLETALALGGYSPEALGNLGAAYVALAHVLLDRGPATRGVTPLLERAREVLLGGIAIVDARPRDPAEPPPEVLARLEASVGRADLELATRAASPGAAVPFAREAREHLRRATELDASARAAWLARALAGSLEAFGVPLGAGRDAGADALASLERVGPLAPDDPDAVPVALARARALRALGRHGEAFEVADDLAAATEAPAALLIWGEEACAVASELARHAPDAEPARDRVVRARPRFEALARTLVAEGQASRAAAFYRTAAAIALQVQEDPDTAGKLYRAATRGLPPGPERDELDFWARKLGQ